MSYLGCVLSLIITMQQLDVSRDDLLGIFYTKGKGY